MLTFRRERPRVFVSYVHENAKVVDKLVADLQVRGLDVWHDKKTLKGGMYWKDKIREAIKTGDFFIACFSLEYQLRLRTYMNAELQVAIDEIRMRSNRTWFIPILLSGAVPNIAISDYQTLADIFHVDFSVRPWRESVNLLSQAVYVAVAEKEAREQKLLEQVLTPSDPLYSSSSNPLDSFLAHPRDSATAISRISGTPRKDIPVDQFNALDSYQERVRRQLELADLSEIELTLLGRLLRGPFLKPASVSMFYASIEACVSAAFPGTTKDLNLPAIRNLVRECYDQDGEWQLRLLSPAVGPVAAFLDGREH